MASTQEDENVLDPFADPPQVENEEVAGLVPPNFKSDDEGENQREESFEKKDFKEKYLKLPSFDPEKPVTSQISHNFGVAFFSL